MEESRFGEFWAAYPVKTGRIVAERIWRTMQLMGELTPEMVTMILAAVEKQKKWERWRAGFIRNPAKWLQERGWEDEEPPRLNWRHEPTPRVTLNTYIPTEPVSKEEAAKAKELIHKAARGMK